MTTQATRRTAGVGPTGPTSSSGGRRTGVRDRLLASDPGNVRLTLATRAAVTLGVALGVAALLASLLGLAGNQAVVVIVLGAVLTMITTFTASDPTPAGRALTQLCLPVAMLAGITVSTLVDRHRVLSLLVFVVVMFAAVWVRRFGPRAFACGMVAWMGYFIALFLQLSFAQLPVVLAAVATTTVLLLVIALVVAPQRPARRLQRMVDAFAARTRIALAEHRDPDRRPPWRRRDETAADRAVLRVNEAAVLVDGQLAVPGALADPHRAGDVRAAVLRAEAALARALDDPGDPDGVDAALADLDAVLDDDRHARPRRGVGDDEPVPFAPAAELFAGFLPGSAVTVGPMVAPDEGAAGGHAGAGLLLSTRQALQIALAGGLSIALGDAVSGQRWYWAVLACFLAFTGTATAAETVRKAVQRTVGTVVGVVVALVVVPLLGPSPAVALAVILVAIFAGFYLFRVSYTSLAFAITLVVAELYELLGTYSGGLLALRVGETALGALVGGIVAVTFLPTTAVRAEHAARARLAEELRAATGDVAALVHPGGRPGARPDLHARARSLDAAVHQLALIGVPLSLRTVPGGARRRPLLVRRLAAWVRCAVRVRALVEAAEELERTRRSDPAERHDRVGAAVRAVQGLVDALAEGRDPGEHRHRPPDDGPDDLLAELAALHGALVALHEIDPTVAPVAPAAPAAPPAVGTGLHGRVTDDGGRGLPAVVTLVDGNGAQRARVRSDDDGRFAVAVAPEERSWQLVVAAAGHAPHAGRVSGPGEHGIVLRATGPAPRPATARRVTPASGPVGGRAADGG
ncbi:FUSC family protein [Actinomycetospora sp. OC33-EN08]|uniref:FUSC family protein n=1 Tax=Actinomycetospora aurantiaca TaxID=3129233 RepID=A0ABU8MPC9_9PSEU